MVTVGIFDISAILAQIMPLVAWAIIKTTQNWRICYYIIIAFEVLTVIFLYFFYHPPKFSTKHAGTGHTVSELLRNFDWLGLFLFIAGCTLFIVGINWGGTLYPWTSATTIAPIAVGLVLLIILGLYEAYGNLKEPLLPPRLFSQFRT
jgi:MFS family permease